MEGEYGGLIRQTPSVDVGECPQQVVARRSAAVGRRCWPIVSVLHQVVARRSAGDARRLTVDQRSLAVGSSSSQNIGSDPYGG